MPFKNRLFLFSLLVLLAALLAIVFAPVAVSNGLRLWVWWKSRQEGLTVSIDKIDAPFLQPVVIRGFRLGYTPKTVAAEMHLAQLGDARARRADADLAPQRNFLRQRD